MHELLRDDARQVLERVQLDPLAGKTVLIIGSNGLIGSQMARVLFEANRVLGLNTRIIGVSRRAPSALLDGLTADPRVTFIAQDLTQGCAIEERVDVILHCATYGQPKKFLADRLTTIALNTVLTEQLLQKCRRDGASMMFASSAEVYGQPDAAHRPTPETYDGACATTTPRAAYSESKRLGETLCAVYQDTQGVQVRIARIATAYGPGISIDDERVLGHFLRQAMLEGHIRLLDQGEQLRTWCYLTDCVVMLFHVLLYGRELVYNVGGNHTCSVRQLAELICALTGARYSLPPKDAARPELAKGPDHVQLDITKVIREFGVVPQVGLREGLSQVIQWHREAVLSQRQPGDPILADARPMSGGSGR